MIGNLRNPCLLCLNKPFKESVQSRIRKEIVDNNDLLTWICSLYTLRKTSLTYNQVSSFRHAVHCTVPDLNLKTSQRRTLAESCCTKSAGTHACVTCKHNEVYKSESALINLKVCIRSLLLSSHERYADKEGNRCSNKDSTKDYKCLTLRCHDRQGDEVSRGCRSNKTCVSNLIESQGRCTTGNRSKKETRSCKDIREVDFMDTTK